MTPDEQSTLNSTPGTARTEVPAAAARKRGRPAVVSWSVNASA